MAKKLSRLGIFVFFDPQGVVDTYVTHLLGALRPHFEKLVVISNTDLDATGTEALGTWADVLHFRANRGLDAAAYKEGLIRVCGWEELGKYDEVVLINDTFYGPIPSFDKMFADMAELDLDFWGMAAGYPSVDGWNKVKYGYIPSHIQTFFVAFRQNMVRSQAFRSYWEQYDETLSDFESVVTQHEVIMTKHFEDLGFRWGICADTEKYASESLTENFNIYYHHPYKMMKDMDFPVLKRKVLAGVPELLYMADLEEPAQAMAYIQNHSDYDTGMIWENLLRLYNVADIYHGLHLNYVLPSVPVAVPEKKRAALVFHAANPFFAQELCDSAAKLADTVDVYLLPEQGVTVPEDLPETVKILPPTGQDTEMGGFVLGCRELAGRYDYLGFVHDVGNPTRAPMTAPESAVWGYLKNIAGDSAYVSQILDRFASEPHLGVLGAPFPVHHDYFKSYGNRWQGSYNRVRELAETLDLRCKLSEKSQPIMTDGAFWCRTAALETLWKECWTADRFRRNSLTNRSPENEALKRILPYAAQSEGYYSGVVMHTEYASMRLTTQQYMLDGITDATRQGLGFESASYSGYLRHLQAFGTDAQGSPVMVDASKFGFTSLIRIWLYRTMPRWLFDAVANVYRFAKRLLGKN